MFDDRDLLPEAVLDPAQQARARRMLSACQAVAAEMAAEERQADRLRHTSPRRRDIARKEAQGNRDQRPSHAPYWAVYGFLAGLAFAVLVLGCGR